IESIQLLRPNGVFQDLTWLHTYPNPSTVGRFLLPMAPTALPKLHALHDRFLMHMTARPHRPIWLIFDIDSTVLVVYGNQERALVDYNPIKPSYHPLRFEGRTKDFWHGELRPSDAHTASRPRDLLREDSGGRSVGDCPCGQRVLRPQAGLMTRRAAGSVRDCRPSDGPVSFSRGH